MEITLKKDGSGDVYSKDYGRYTNPNMYPAIEEHFNQLSKNYESAFGDKPTKEELESAIKFVEMFCGEICEMYPRSWKAKSASDVAGLIGADVLDTCEKIASI
jgi:hypothetical protein